MLKLLSLSMLLLTGCVTKEFKEPEVADMEAQCAKIQMGNEIVTGCGLPAGIICIKSANSISCFQMSQGQSY